MERESHCHINSDLNCFIFFRHVDLEQTSLQIANHYFALTAKTKVDKDLETWQSEL